MFNYSSSVHGRKQIGLYALLKVFIYHWGLPCIISLDHIYSQACTTGLRHGNVLWLPFSHQFIYRSIVNISLYSIGLHYKFYDLYTDYIHCLAKAHANKLAWQSVHMKTIFSLPQSPSDRIHWVVVCVCARINIHTYNIIAFPCLSLRTPARGCLDKKLDLANRVKII